jgi:nucleoside-diphosphate-sugar epimerase
VTDTLRAYRGARVLVLGAAGFIGRWVARKVSEVGAEVVSGVRHRAAFADVASLWSITGEVVEFDAIDPDTTRRVVTAARADVVFNLVGYGVDRSEKNVEVMQRLNCDFIRHVVDAITVGSAAPGWTGRRLVHVGSALEYGLVSGMVRETMTPLPHTDYGRTKLAGTIALEEAASRAQLPAVTARAFTVFGPGEHDGRLLPAIRQAARAGTVVRLSAGTQRRDFGYVEDLAEGLLRLGLSSGTPGEIVNVGTGRLTSVREFAETAGQVAGLGPDRLEFGAEPIRSDEMHVTGVDVGTFRQLTGWSLPADLVGLFRRAAAFEGTLAGR